MARRRRSKTNTTFFLDIEDSSAKKLNARKWKKTDKWKNIVF